MPDYIDINGALSVQQNLLNNPSNQPPNVIDNIKGNLNSLYRSYREADASTDAVLTQQSKVKEIVDSEFKRLTDKKKSVDNSLVGQKRIIELNNSNRLRQQGYTKLLVIFIITLVLFVLLIILSKNITFIPQIFFELIAIIIISISIYLAFNTFLDIQSRSKMDFNKLDIPEIKNISGNTIASGSETNLMSSLNVCITSDCCGPETKWDILQNKCVKEVKQQGFTTLSNIGNNEPTEFSNYTLV
uniref:Uncharacterized protein n=1 Tax=viral metagenome TaxID=1070528 RepID=A0A6C0JQ83_9ZZZZ